MAMRQIRALVLGLLLAEAALNAARAQESANWRLFRRFVSDFRRPYTNDSAEMLHRFAVFRQSLARHAKLNAAGDTARYGVNKFSDLTPQEFQDRYIRGSKLDVRPKSSPLPSVSASFPDKFDWRLKGVVNGIRNQGKCGSCWAFAVVETIASRYAIQSNQLLQLSPQQLISCNRNRYLDGCKGGNIYFAFYVLNDTKPTALEKDYPFTSGDGSDPPCEFPSSGSGLQVQGFFYSGNMTETMMAQILSKYSPLTTSANAVSWQDYVGGIIQHHCTKNFVDHAVQLVAYDLTGEVPYWTVRNTWGSDWGEKGYVRLKFGENTCGIADEVAGAINVTYRSW